MKLLVIVIVILLISIVVPDSFAHSGRTDSSGGHNCSDSSISKGLCTGYHFHNGGSAPAFQQTEPAPAVIAPAKTPQPVIETPKPTVRPTVKPTSKPSVKPTPVLTPSPVSTVSAEVTPSPVGEVKAIQTEQVPEVKKSGGFFDWLFSFFK